jgi:hypothetical protein
MRIGEIRIAKIFLKEDQFIYDRIVFDLKLDEICKRELQYDFQIFAVSPLFDDVQDLEGAVDIPRYNVTIHSTPTEYVNKITVERLK